MNREAAIEIRTALSNPRQPLTIADRVLILRTSAGLFSVFAIVAPILVSWPTPEFQRAAVVFGAIAFVSAVVFAMIAPKYMELWRADADCERAVRAAVLEGQDVPGAALADAA